MLNRKLLEVLSRLPPEGHQRLRMFLETPYFNSGRNSTHLLHLYDYISAYEADENRPELSKEVVSLSLFPNRIFREKEKTFLDTLTSELFALVRRFFALQQWENTEAPKQELFSMLRFYREHELEERFWQTVAAMRKMQEARSPRDADYYYTQFSLEEEVCNYRSLYNTFEDDTNINRVHQSLDEYYSTVKIEYLCAIAHQHRLAQVSFEADSPLIRAVLQLPEQDSQPEVVLIKVYKQVFDLLNHPDSDEVFLSFEKMLEQHQQDIPADKYRDLMTYYRYFWTSRYIRTGDETSLRKMFDLNRDHLEKGYFHLNGKVLIVPLRILNTFALKVGQFEWAKKILDEHPPERICGTRYPAEAQRLNYGEYYFYLKEYEEALNCVVYRPFENPHFSILADVLLIKIYFETQNELLEHRMKALYQKVRRTKIAAYAKKRYFNFLKKLDKIYKYGWQKSSPRKARLAEEIRLIPSIIDREWLLKILI